MKTVSWIILAGLVGGLLGAALAWVNTAGVLLLAAADAYVLVADGSGQLYLYQRFADTWAPLEAGQAAAYPNQALAGPANHFVPAPPDGTLGVAYVLDPSQGSALDYGAYALGPDGSVWAWFQSDAPAGRLANLRLLVAGAAVGAALAGLIGLARRATRSKA